MSFPRVNSGDRLRMPAKAYNFLLDSAEDWQANRDNSQFGQLLGWPTTFGKLRNDSGKDLDRFDVVGIDPPLILPSENLAVFQRQVTFSGVDPVLARHQGAFGILVQPIADGAIGSAIIAGCSVVGVTVPGGPFSGSGFGSGSGSASSWISLQDQGLVFAEVQETFGFENVLQLGSSGSARVLWAEDLDNVDGWRWAYVRIGHALGSRQFAKINPQGNSGSGSGSGGDTGDYYDATLYRYSSTGTPRQSTGVNIWLFDFMKITNVGLTAGAYYPADPTGDMKTLNGDTRPVYNGIGGWLSKAECVGGNIKNTTY